MLYTQCLDLSDALTHDKHTQCLDLSGALTHDKHTQCLGLSGALHAVFRSQWCIDT